MKNTNIFYKILSKNKKRQNPTQKNKVRLKKRTRNAPLTIQPTIFHARIKCIYALYIAVIKNVKFVTGLINEISVAIN